MFKKIKKNQNRGYVTLIGVIVFGSICLSLAVTILLLGISSAKTGIVDEKSKQALALAHACGEEALEIIRENNNFTGTGSLSLDGGSCEYTVSNQGGEVRNVASSGSVGTIIRKVEIQIDQIVPQINVTTWQEVADF